MDKLKTYFRNEKNIFIFKSIGDEEQDEAENENTYQKLKNLEKAQEDLSSLFLVKTRILEKEINKLKDEIKKGQNNQGKAVEELRDTVGGGITEIQELIEDLTNKTNSNNEVYMKEFKNVKELKDNFEKTNEEINNNKIVLNALKQMLEKKK